MIPLNQFIKANMPSIAAYYETFSVRFKIILLLF